MTDEQLDSIFKTANEISYAAALRAVYTQGIMDAVATPPIPIDTVVDTQQIQPSVQ